MTANHEYAPTTADIRNAVTRDESDWREAGAQFDRWFAAEIAAAEQRGAVRELRKFAHAQDTWGEEGRAEQRISRIAMRDALLDRADQIQDPDAPTADELHADWLETRAGQTPEENHE